MTTVFEKVSDWAVSKHPDSTSGHCRPNSVMKSWTKKSQDLVIRRANSSWANTVNYCKATWTIHASLWSASSDPLFTRITSLGGLLCGMNTNNQSANQHGKHYTIRQKKGTTFLLWIKLSIRNVIWQNLALLLSRKIIIAVTCLICGIYTNFRTCDVGYYVINHRWW